MSKTLSVVLTSGGLNSAVAAALEAQECRLALLHVQYNQQAMEPEHRAFEAISDWLDPQERQVVTLGDWPALTDSALVKAHHDIEDAAAVGDFAPASTFVPMLSPVMLCVGAAWAKKLGAQRVVWGICADNLGHYPDRNDAARLLAWQLMGQCLGDRLARTIEAPLAQYPKPAVAALATQFKVPVNATWSCLRGGFEPCGRCIGCVGRKAALGPVKAAH
jgi:7-cyano-7-deazaguanine synthase